MSLNTSINNLRYWLCFGKNFLREANIQDYSIDAEVLLMEALGFNRVQLFTNDNYLLSDYEVKVYLDFLNKRKLFMPVQYITGKCEFMSLDFIVNTATLIPRGDTEILAESVISFINQNNFKTVLDIGTGSGALAISIAHYCPNVRVIASDISEEALRVAEKNAEFNNVIDRVDFIKSDIFENISAEFDVIVSNPPYIKSEIINTLIPQVRDYEPVLALDGGMDGLFFYKKIISQCGEYINYNGMLFFEIGFDQSEEVSGLLYGSGFSCVEIKKDLSGLDRVVYCVNNKGNAD